MATVKVKVKMLQSLIGTPAYRKGSEQHLDAETAENWAKKGLCEIIEKESSAKQSNNTTSRGTTKRKRGK